MFQTCTVRYFLTPGCVHSLVPPCILACSPSVIFRPCPKWRGVHTRLHDIATIQFCLVTFHDTNIPSRIPNRGNTIGNIRFRHVTHIFRSHREITPMRVRINQSRHQISTRVIRLISFYLFLCYFRDDPVLYRNGHSRNNLSILHIYNIRIVEGYRLSVWNQYQCPQ